MSLDELLARDAKGVFTDPDGIGELITWRRPAGGTDPLQERQVRATVDRLGRLADERGKESWQAIVFVPRDEVVGIPNWRNATPTTPADELFFDMKVKGGPDPSWNRIMRLNSQDAGGFEVECIR